MEIKKIEELKEEVLSCIESENAEDIKKDIESNTDFCVQICENDEEDTVIALFYYVNRKRYQYDNFITNPNLHADCGLVIEKDDCINSEYFIDSMFAKFENDEYLEENLEYE